MQPQKARLASTTIARMRAAASVTRILIVDQDREVGMALSFMLSARRFDEVRAVKSTGRALTVTEQFRPEIVFLDLDLPDGGTMAIARKLIQGARGPKPRLIALSKNAEPAVRARTRADGFERCLEKPISNEALDEILGLGQTG